jgi:hypothetical protein
MIFRIHPFFLMSGCLLGGKRKLGKEDVSIPWASHRTERSVLIELKRSRTPREVVAQALDYAEWAETSANFPARKVEDGQLKQLFHEPVGDSF